MNFNCQREDLLFGVQIIGKAISAKNTMPILNGILIIAESGRLTLRATDLDIAVQCDVPADVAEEGKPVIADGKRFIDIVRQLPENNINISLINDYDVKINYGVSSINVRGFESEQFPQLPDLQGDMNGSMKGDIFSRVVKQTAIAASNDEIQPIMTGILLDIEGENINFVATDMHRLTLAKGIWQTANRDSMKVIVPAKTMSDVAALADAEETVEISISHNNICFKLGSTIFVSRLISGQFPDYKPIIPKEESFNHQIFVNKNQLNSSLKRASLLSKDANNTVRLEFKPEQIVMTANTSDIGDIREVIPAQVQGDELLVGYNLKYILDFLKVSSSENIYMKLSGNLTPGTMTEEDNEVFTYIILPLRLVN
jgi:DNA polymerase-3 subunit beta